MAAVVYFAARKTEVHDDGGASCSRALNNPAAVPSGVVVAAAYVDYCAVNCCATKTSDCATNEMKYSVICRDAALQLDDDSTRSDDELQSNFHLLLL